MQLGIWQESISVDWYLYNFLSLLSWLWNWVDLMSDYVIGRLCHEYQSRSISLLKSIKIASTWDLFHQKDLKVYSSKSLLIGGSRLLKSTFGVIGNSVEMYTIICSRQEWKHRYETIVWNTALTYIRLLSPKWKHMKQEPLDHASTRTKSNYESTVTKRYCNS